MNKLMLLVQFLCVYLYCRGVFYFGPHNISWLYEVGLHIYHCRITVMYVISCRFFGTSVDHTKMAARKTGGV